jgi:6-phosphogluconolactonase/glucosamine-6-phosphate isomerase/deaminase
MTIYKVNDIYPAVDYLEKTIKKHLEAGKKVLWLLTGGSGIKIEVAVSQKLNGTELKNLTVMLTDERYPHNYSEDRLADTVNHPDSNWKQILDMGFTLEGATLIPILQGKNITGTTASFEKSLSDLLQPDTYKIGLFGIGTDAHTAGILPNSSAAHENARLASWYDAEAFQRITMTFKAIRKLDEAVLCAFGNDKKPALEFLQDKDIKLNDHPVQILRSLPKLTVFNDQIGEKL